jgi:pentatricopeptide repeat protein
MSRDAFWDARAAAPDDPRMKAALASPFVPAALEYPSSVATKRSRQKAQKAARVIMALDTIWAEHLHSRHFLTSRLGWETIFSDLKAMTPRGSEDRKISALRVRLPETWDLDLKNKTINFVESSTGVVAKLRTSPYYKGSSVIVLRGWSETLARAADELVAACKDVEVFELGEVASLDDDRKQLWPELEMAQDDGTILPEDLLGSIWVHRENVEERIDIRYEDIAKPSEWTVESLKSYITRIVRSRLHPDLAVATYGHLNTARKERKPTQRGLTSVDTDGVKVKLILETLQDPAVQRFVTPSVLKLALAFMGHRGGHRAAARRLFEYAEENGLPVDTETYNVMLESYVKKRDARFFYKLLRRMRARYIEPNAWTWLLFMQLIQREEHRGQVAIAMWEHGNFKDPAIRRGIASIMVKHDAYSAFRTGMTLKGFLDSRTARYGQDWLTTKAVRALLVEYLGFHDSQPLEVKTADITQLLDRQIDDGGRVRTPDINIILSHCRDVKDWDMASWTLSLLERHGCQADETTYEAMIELAVETQRPRALGVLLFYAISERKFNFRSRWYTSMVLTGGTRDIFWQHNQPHVFSASMLQKLKPKEGRLHVPRTQLTNKIRSECGGYVPAKPIASLADSALQLDSLDNPRDVKPAEIELHHPGNAELPTRTVTLTHAFEWFTNLTLDSPHRVHVEEPSADDLSEETIAQLHQDLAQDNCKKGEALVQS